MNITEEAKEGSRGSGYLRCLSKVMAKTHQLFCEDDAALNYEGVHSVKSILYAAIEQAGKIGRAHV